MSQRTQGADSQTAATTNGGFTAVGPSPHPPRRSGQGHGQGTVRRGHRPAGNAPRGDAAEPPRPRSHHLHRHEQGRGPPRREGRGHQRGPGPGVGEARGGGGGRRHEHPVPQQQHSCRGQGPLQGPRGGCRSRLQPPRGGGGPCAHRRDLRGAAGGHHRRRGDEARRPHPPRPTWLRRPTATSLPRRATSPNTSSSSSETRSRASRKPTWSWNASTAPGRSTRATSSPRTAPPGGRPTAT